MMKIHQKIQRIEDSIGRWPCIPGLGWWCSELTEKDCYSNTGWQVGLCPWYCSVCCEPGGVDTTGRSDRELSLTWYGSSECLSNWADDTTKPRARDCGRGRPCRERYGETDLAEGRNMLVSVKTLAEDERYSKYFKMLKMGVPLQVRPALTLSVSSPVVGGCEEQDGRGGAGWRRAGPPRRPGPCCRGQRSGWQFCWGGIRWMGIIQ